MAAFLRLNGPDLADRIVEKELTPRRFPPCQTKAMKVAASGGKFTAEGDRATLTAGKLPCGGRSGADFQPGDLS